MGKSLAVQPLIEELTAHVRNQLNRVRSLEGSPQSTLERRPRPDSWSILEVLEHLNLSSGHYVRRLEKIYAGNGKLTLTEQFVPGRWGEKFTQSILPLPDGSVANPMRTIWFFKPKAAATKGINSLTGFEAMLETQLALLNAARTKGLDGTKVTSTLGPLFRFKPGDAFRFMIAHQQRHFLQLERALKVVSPQQ
ncbi:MAG: DinB family protein [Flavobacteriales bacterium]|jgi:hypothetical protein|nr:DinB family protein [Flavobacteriales bacterium]